MIIVKLSTHQHYDTLQDSSLEWYCCTINVKLHDIERALNQKKFMHTNTVTSYVLIHYTV